MRLFHVEPHKWLEGLSAQKCARFSLDTTRDAGSLRAILPKSLESIAAPVLSSMFVASKAEATAIRAAYEVSGELGPRLRDARGVPVLVLSAAVELRECARIIASWEPLPKLPTARTHRRKEPRSAS